LFKKWKLAPNTVNQRLAALRFFYIQTLNKAWSVAETPYPKKTLYASGMRRAELARLKIRDIDSQRMVIHILRPCAEITAHSVVKLSQSN
jgi:integrase/recombinase XerD